MNPTSALAISLLPSASHTATGWGEDWYLHWWRVMRFGNEGNSQEMVEKIKRCTSNTHHFVSLTATANSEILNMWKETTCRLRFPRFYILVL